MVSQAFLGGVAFSRLNITVSPNAYELIEEDAALSGLGITNPLVDVTSHDSAAREYIGGLPDGSEITLECNYIQTAGSKQEDLISDVENKLTSGFQLVITDPSVSPVTVKTFTFDAVCLSYEIAPSFDDKHMITFTLKITGLPART